MPEQSVIAARAQFLQRGAIADALVPKAILRSWTRCAGLGLRMAGGPSVEPIAARALKERREQHDLLRRRCRSELEALNAEVRATDGIVILTDASGLVLERLGSMNFADRAARVALSPGASWREAATGTNANRRRHCRAPPDRGAWQRALFRAAQPPELLGGANHRSARDDHWGA
jgi:transcriptional regulator of acetoin/glycerol metabolism